MPPRPSLFEYGTRNFICSSCLSALRKRPIVTPWPLRQLSQAAEAPSRTKRQARKDDAERQKTLESLGLLKDNTSKPAVNYFEQEDNGKLRRLQDKDEFGKALVDPGGELDARLKQLEDQLQNVTSMARLIEKMGGKDEADRLRKQFSQDPDDDFDDVLEESDEVSVSHLAIPFAGLTGVRQRRITKLNKWIARSSDMLAKKMTFLPDDIHSLWKAYSGARINMSDRWHTVPEPAWEVLWRVLSSEYTLDASRMSYIYTLARDMQHSGVPLRPEQQLLALECMFIDGWESEAIENHRRHTATLGADPKTSARFWQLGLRMYCHVGDLERAKRIADTISESSNQADPRFILPFIKLCAETSEAVETGLRYYRDLRAKLGDSMIIEDYDIIISYFLAAGRTEHALVIFVDMMKSGTIDLLNFQRYPPSVGNPFFFGKWLKRLIGMGDLEGAYNVFLLMRSHSITPRAIHVNGLIGAWLRSGTAENFQKAEDLAWTMINTRIQFVELRRRSSSLVTMELFQSGGGWPRANLETFSLLAENFRERNLSAKMASLWQSFQEAEIAPDSFMLNQLLMSRLQDGKGEAVLDIYHDMLEHNKITPDSHTFMILWQALPVNRFTKIPDNDIILEVSRTRALFAEMMQHAPIFKTGDGMAIDNFLARNIFHSFRKLTDRCGLLLALRALRRIFNYNPPDMVTFELLLGTQDLERLTKRREGAKLLLAKKNLDQYLAHAQEELVKSGEIKDNENLSEEVKAEETGNYLEMHLESAYVQAAKEEAQRLARDAAQEMGLQSPGDQDAESDQDFS